MKHGQVKAITLAVDNRRRRMVYLAPLFLGAVTIGFLLELSTYKTLTLNLDEIKQALANIPHRWKPKPSEYHRTPDFNEDLNDNINKLEEQQENETRIIDNVGSLSPPSSSSRIPRFYEEPTLINLKNFSWLMNNDTLCKLDSENRLMPVLVHTARDHFAERVALRKSWGSVPLYKKWDVRLVFLLGEADRGANPAVNQKQFQEQEKLLLNEQLIYGDLVIGSFIDSYHNLTYKHLMGYKWILNFCPNATFVLKIDDDMFIDILRWLDWRSDDLQKLEHDNLTIIPDLYCHTFRGTKPIREKGSKWYASEEDWPEEYYPDYCSGWAYAITTGLMEILYSVTDVVKFFWVDDVYATGPLLQYAMKKYNFMPEVKHIWGNVSGDIREYRPMCDSGNLGMNRSFRAVVYVPRGDLFERDLMCMWNKTLHDSNYNFS